MASESSIKIKIRALSKALLGKNYQLRLLAGEKIIDIPTSKFRMDIYLSQKSSKTKLKMSKAKMTTKQSIKAVSQTTTAQSAVKPWELPDLIITPCEVRYMLHGCASDPSGKFMIYWKVKNQGFKPAFFEHNQRIVKWWRTDPEGNATGSLTGGGWVEYAPSTGLMIMPGDEYVATSYDWFCVVGSKVGTYTYTYYTDPNGKVLESNENNNQRTCTFEITSDMFPYVPSYDLTIIAASAIPSSGPAETTYFASQITVKNIGDDQAPEAYVYGIGGLVSVKALAPGESITVTTTPLTYLMPPGQKTIECKVESKDRSMRDKDKDTTNNTKSVTFQVTSGGE